MILSNEPNFFVRAMNKLYPGYGYAIKHSGEIVWSTTQPSNFSIDDVKIEEANLKQEYINSKYQRDRQPEYPSLGEFADAMYWSSKGDNTKLDAYYAACEAVKLKYPKAE